ncbi:MAG: hypothetical protein ACFFDF_12030 [Candidatus Odinarchaeota archaeon]
MNKFPCGVKHNFNTGVIIKSDDRKKYEWNYSTFKMNENIFDKENLEDFKTSGRVIYPQLSYE